MIAKRPLSVPWPMDIPASQSDVGDGEAEFVMAAFSSSFVHRRVLQAVSEVMGVKGWVAGGFVRESVWNYVSRVEHRVWESDVDVIYFDEKSRLKASEREWEASLRANFPQVDWSVKNQARMYMVNGDEPYLSLEDALTQFPETASAVAVQVVQGEFNIIAPHGLEDLVGLVYRKSPGANLSDFTRRRPSVLRRDRWPLREDESPDNPGGAF